MSDGCVVPRIEMLTYLRVRSASNTRDALPSNIRGAFKARLGFRLSPPGNQEAPTQAKIAMPVKKIH
jgi:hypothetical protein